MNNELRWALWQLYLIWFWPTRFRRDVEDESGKIGDKLTLRQRIIYLGKLLQWVSYLALLGNVLAGWICQESGQEYSFNTSVFGVLFGMAVGIAMGVTGGVSAGVVGIMAYGVVFGMVFGLGFAVSMSWATAVSSGVVAGVFFSGSGSGTGTVPGGVLGGVSFGATFSLGIGVATGLLGDVSFGTTVSAFFLLAFVLTYFRLTTYPLDFVLNCFIFRIAARSSNQSKRWWKFQPFVWNEVIWLPLPFAAPHLAALVREDRKYGFDQVAFIAAERPLQAGMLPKAHSEVVIDDVTSDELSQLADVSERLAWASEANVTLPPDVQAALPRFQRVSEHVGQFQSLASRERQHAALVRASEDVQQLRKSLAATRGRYVPRLLTVANRWSELIVAERERLEAEQEASRELPNPFVFGNPVDDRDEELFMGRRDVVDQLEANVLGSGRPPTLLLYGARRMGKTSILKQLPRLLGPDFAVADIDCQNPSATESAVGLLLILSRAIATGLQRKRLTIQPPGRDQFAKGNAPFGVFDDWLIQVERELEKDKHSGLCVLMCLDEFERLKKTLDAGWGGDVLDALRNMLQHRPRFVLLFCGSHTFEELGPEWTDRFISARRIRVSYLPREDLVPLLTRPMPNFGLTYEDGAIDSALDATAGQPFLTQAVGFELVQHLNEHDLKKVASKDDVAEAVRRALSTGGEYFANVWSDAGSDGQAVLSAVAAGRELPDDARTIKRLQEHDVLDKRLQFVVPMVERWIRERE